VWSGPPGCRAGGDAADRSSQIGAVPGFFVITFVQNFQQELDLGMNVFVSHECSHENPLLGGAEGVSLRGGSSGWGQPTRAPLQRRGIIFMLNGAVPGGMGNSCENVCKWE